MQCTCPEDMLVDVGGIGKTEMIFEPTNVKDNNGKVVGITINGECLVGEREIHLFQCLLCKKIQLK